MGLKAVVAGATGLVGSRLMHQLLDDIRFERVHILVRRQTGIKHPRLSEHVIDFGKPKQWVNLVKGDVVFSALGTTLKKAGGKKNQYLVDYTYQYELARAARSNGIPAFVLVSSAGANPNSLLFYPRMKGELEFAVEKLNFGPLIIIRPSILEGSRAEKRTGEKVALAVSRIVTSVLFRKYRPIRARAVAQAMINSFFANNDQTGTIIYEPGELFNLAII